MEADADDPRHRLVQGLAEEDRLRFDATDAIAQDAKAVDHRGVRIRPDEGVRIGDAPIAVAVRRVDHDRRQVLEVDLVDDARAGRHDPQVAERGLGPTQQLVALAVPLVLTLDVEGECGGRPEHVDLDGMVDDEIGRDERVDERRVAAEVRHRITHDGEVDDRRDAGEVLEDHPGRHERDLGLRRDRGAPRREGLDVGRVDEPATGVAEHVLEEDLERHRGAVELDPAPERAQPPGIGKAGPEARPGTEWIGSDHASSVGSVSTLAAWKSTADHV